MSGNSQLPSKSVPADIRKHKTINNRRLHYLQKNSPDYFYTSGLSEASPLLYDRLIRQFQTPSEREIESDKRGWAGRMYEDLMRAERRLERLEKERSEELRQLETGQSAEFHTSPIIDEVGNTSIFDEVNSKEEGIQQWEKLMTLRFLNGQDTDIDYDSIDFSEEWDDFAQLNRDKEDDYFDSEEPTWCGDDSDDENTTISSESILKGQTGVQDF
ncbi:coiled-coil domain-containing protein-domain-containing protein [Kockiozyma suomiensis]|uniref:coiled-coil domain-containing protein-domain-containing protein n=1 Tax=Kockiozyma suomiensis TaxID=1337062 RepID=UPI003343C0F6